MKTNLYLKNGIVSISVSMPDGRLRYSTGIRMEESVFNEGKFKAVKELDKLKVMKLTTIQNGAIKAIVNGCTTKKKLLMELEYLTGRKARSGPMLVDFAKEWIEVYKKSHPNATYKSFQTLINHLEKLPIKLVDVDDSYYENLKEYYRKEGYSKNFSTKMIINLRRLLREAEHEGKWKGSLEKFKAGYEEIYNIYLTQDELDRIYTTELPENQRNAADLFLIGCYTGLRYEDFIRLDADHIGEFITIDTLKTRARVSIPVHPVVRELLKRKPHPISNAKMNLYLKDMAFNCEIKGTVIKRTTRGNVSTEDRKERWEMVTTHTARRTFCSLMYLNGMPPELIMKVSGHKSIRQLLSYIKLTSEDAARIMARNPFFNPSAQ